MGSFFKSIGGFFSKLFSHAPSWSHTASTALTLVAPLVNTITTLAVGADVAGEVNNIIGEIKSDLAAAAALVSQSHNASDPSTIATLQNVLGAINNNLSALLTAGHIKNQDTLAKVTLVVNAITGEISAILSVLPKSA
jgi:hypothetical protein